MKFNISAANEINVNVSITGELYRIFLNLFNLFSPLHWHILCYSIVF